jgi:hypothetical protein
MLRRVLITTAVMDAVFALISFGGPELSPMVVVYWVEFVPFAGLILLGALGLTRASDCLFEPDELRIEGGRFDGFRTNWSTLESETTKILDDGTLRLDLGSGVRVNVATARDADERRSLEALLEAIRDREAKRTGDKAASVRAAPSPEVVACAACGAPAVVDDADVVKCRSCGAAVTVPAEVRERVRAARALRREKADTDALVQGLLDQPTPKRVNRLLAAGASLGLLWLPLPIMTRSIPTILVSLAAVALIGAVAFMLIADRRAVHGLTLGFGARVAANEKGVDIATCRRCGAPLPPPVDDGILVACVYCQADNILGVDPRGDERAARSAETDFARELAQRHRARGRARLLAVVVVLVIAAVAVAWMR